MMFSLRCLLRRCVASLAKVSVRVSSVAGFSRRASRIAAALAFAAAVLLAGGARADMRYANNPG
jgi:hypothetical protein